VAITNVKRKSASNNHRILDETPYNKKQRINRGKNVYLNLAVSKRTDISVRLYASGNGKKTTSAPNCHIPTYPMNKYKLFVKCVLKLLVITITLNVHIMTL
jgi:hypothetical protein